MRGGRLPRWNDGATAPGDRPSPHPGASAAAPVRASEGVERATRL